MFCRPLTILVDGLLSCLAWVFLYTLLLSRIRLVLCLELPRPLVCIHHNDTCVGKEECDSTAGRSFCSHVVERGQDSRQFVVSGQPAHARITGSTGTSLIQGPDTVRFRNNEHKTWRRGRESVCLDHLRMRLHPSRSQRK